MAQMARDYYDSVQYKDQPEEYGRMLATEITLEKCKARLSEGEFNDIDAELAAEDIAEALRLSNNGKYPGIDGIPYEFYKTLNILHQESKGTDHESFDVLGFLQLVYVDIKKYGIVASTHFNMGWMCPIFKKGRQDTDQ
ncbi:hypothetical protein B0H14DRAFT_2357352 [Mycena olivaceomarginata]|nr:hypothetical protein B0H14DRAFT_2357352 [Mycena olivaceomarginata]